MGQYVNALKKELEELEKSDGFYRGEKLEESDFILPEFRYGDFLVEEKLEPEPERRQEYEEELEKLDAEMRRMVDLEATLIAFKDDIRTRVASIAKRFSTEYNEEKVIRSANWYFKNVRHIKANERGEEFQDSECASDGMTYLTRCLQSALGEQQEFKIVNVMYMLGHDGMEIFFVVPKCLGVWSLRMPFALRKSTLHDWHGKYNSSAPVPMQMSITYCSPCASSYIQTIMSAWTFREMAEKWAAFDMNEHRKKQYLSFRVDKDGYVLVSSYDPRFGKYEDRTEFTKNNLWPG
jgi:hypothetical protein